MATFKYFPRFPPDPLANFTDPRAKPVQTGICRIKARSHALAAMRTKRAAFSSKALVKPPVSKVILLNSNLNLTALRGIHGFE